MEKPTLELVGDMYRFVWADSGIRIDLDRLGEGHDGPKGEAVIYSTRPECPGLLHIAKLTLLSTSSRQNVCRGLERRDGVKDIDWDGLLQQLSFLASERWRRGEPLIDLSTVDWRARPRWLVRPFVAEGVGSCIFAKGGSGKSLIAIALAVTIATGEPVVGELVGDSGPVLYLDWESDEYDHAEYLEAICKGAGIRHLPPVLYQRPKASLHESIHHWRKEVAEARARAVIIDSFSAASGGQSSDEEAAIKLYSAARTLGCAFIVLDHVTKNGDTLMPIGTVQKHNQARLTWAIETDAEQSATEMTVALINQKRNRGPRSDARRGYRIHFTNDPVTEECQCVDFAPVDLADTALANKLPLRERILHELSGGAIATTELADRLGKPESTVGPMLSNLRKRGVVVYLPDRRWGLAVQRA